MTYFFDYFLKTDFVNVKSYNATYQSIKKSQAIQQK